MLTLRCTKCGNMMKYQPTPGVLSDRRKRCVYCGRTFIARKNIVSET